ncbi:hypothetical protein [Psychrobacillus sp. L4]|uniref:hypothetical protein n=1 Tax=Psychrobacillus sp. L4 TaxID=3236892 RepID=UPI0036F1A90C
MIDRALLKQTIKEIASIEGIQMDPNHLALDVLALSEVFKENESQFKNVINSLKTAIYDVINNDRIGEDLKFNLEGWKSYHFSSPYPKFQGEEDMRMVYQPISHILILAFGHRYITSDFYQRFQTRI